MLVMPPFVPFCICSFYRVLLECSANSVIEHPLIKGLTSVAFTTSGFEKSKTSASLLLCIRTEFQSDLLCRSISQRDAKDKGIFAEESSSFFINKLLKIARPYSGGFAFVFARWLLVIPWFMVFQLASRAALNICFPLAAIGLLSWNFNFLAARTFSSILIRAIPFFSIILYFSPLFRL